MRIAARPMFWWYEDESDSILPNPGIPCSLAYRHGDAVGLQYLYTTEAYVATCDRIEIRWALWSAVSGLFIKSP